jgi:hypothetical protein
VKNGYRVKTSESRLRRLSVAICNTVVVICSYGQVSPDCERNAYSASWVSRSRNNNGDGLFITQRYMVSKLTAD